MNSKSWLITAPTLGLILLFVIWSGYWYVLKEKASDEIDKAISDMKNSGINLTCSEKTYTGYPFRIQFDCAQPSLHLKRGKTSAKANASHLKILAQAYKLRHFIAEIKGMISFDITQNSTVSTISPTHTTGTIRNKDLRASLILSSLTTNVGDFKNIESLSVISHNLKTDVLRKTSWGQKIPFQFTAEKAGLHLRDPKHPGIKGTDTDIAIEAIKFDGTGNFYTPFGGNKFAANRFVLNGLLRSFYPALTDKNSLPKNWHKLGGVAEIDAIYIERDDFTVKGEGILSLDSSGQLSGSLDAKFLGIENIFNTLISQKLLSKNQAVLAQTGLQILSKSTEQEHKAKILTIPMNFTKGQIYFGPHSLGFSPSFF